MMVVQGLGVMRDQELQRGFARNVVSVLRLTILAKGVESTMMLRPYMRIIANNIFRDTY